MSQTQTLSALIWSVAGLLRMPIMIGLLIKSAAGV